MSIRAAVKSTLPADLVAAGVVTATNRVYFGRQRQGVPMPDEIWVEDIGGEAGSEFGFQRVTRYPYVLHVFVLGNNGPAQTGSALVDTLEAKADAIRDRYHAQCPSAFKLAIPGLVHAEALVEELDADPEERRYLEGTVRVTFTVAE